MKLSIVIPCFNEGESIIGNLKALLNQDYKFIKKIVVVDDCIFFLMYLFHLVCFLCAIKHGCIALHSARWQFAFVFYSCLIK